MEFGDLGGLACREGLVDHPYNHRTLCTRNCSRNFAWMISHVAGFRCRLGIHVSRRSVVPSILSVLSSEMLTITEKSCTKIRVPCTGLCSSIRFVVSSGRRHPSCLVVASYESQLRLDLGLGACEWHELDRVSTKKFANLLASKISAPGFFSLKRGFLEKKLPWK